MGRRADVDAAAGGHPRPVPQERPAGRAGAGDRAARPGARALVRGRHRARPAGRLARGPAARRRRAGARARPAVGRPRRRRSRDDWEVLRRAYFENAVGPRRTSPATVAERLDSREMLHKRLKKTFKDERLRLVAAHPFVADGPRPAQRAGLGRPDGLPRAAVRRVDGHRRDGRRSPTALTARLATRGVTVALEVEATDLVVRDGRAVAVATDVGRGRRGRGRVRGRPAAAARARAVRRAHDADDAAGGLPRRPRRRPVPRPAARDGRCTATRCSSSAPAAGLRPAVRRRRCTAAASSPRTSSTALARHELDVRTDVVTRVDRQPARPGRAVGQLAVRRAVAGPRHGAAAARAAHPDRGRVRRRRARDTGQRAAVRRTVRRAGRAGGRAGLSYTRDQVTVRLGRDRRSRRAAARRRPSPSRRSRRVGTGPAATALGDRLDLAQRRVGKRGEEVRLGARVGERASRACAIASEGSRTASSTPSTRSRPLTA